MRHNRRLLALFLALTVLFVASPRGSCSSYGMVRIQDSSKATYLATTTSFNPIASATDMVAVTGSSTKTIKILLITIGYFSNTTSIGRNDFYIVRRSSADSGGTPTTVTAQALDTNNASATATIKYYPTGSNPTLGTTVGTLKVTSLAPLNTGYPLAQGEQTVFDWRSAGQAITLRGTSDVIAVNNNGATVAGTSPTICVNILFTEE